MHRWRTGLNTQLNFKVLRHAGDLGLLSQHLRDRLHINDADQGRAQFVQTGGLPLTLGGNLEAATAAADELIGDHGYDQEHNQCHDIVGMQDAQRVIGWDEQVVESQEGEDGGGDPGALPEDGGGDPDRQQIEQRHGGRVDPWPEGQQDRRWSPLRYSGPAAGGPWAGAGGSRSVDLHRQPGEHAAAGVRKPLNYRPLAPDVQAGLETCLHQVKGLPEGQACECRGWDSDPRPHDYESCALPLSYLGDDRGAIIKDLAPSDKPRPYARLASAPPAARQT